jgi:S-adenosylmethionine hydrolase
MPIVTLLTDFGTRDWYVAAMKGILLAEAPGVTLVDLTHAIPPGDVAEAAFTLTAAAAHFPPDTVHVAVVDPGVGSRRRLLALEARGQRFLAPDNGLLSWLLPEPGAPLEGVRSIERPDLYRPAVGATFHGRDRFAPVAAALARGAVVPRELGPTVRDPVRLSATPPRRDGEVLVGEVIHVDHFGNLVTNLPSPWVATAVVLVAEVAGHRAVRRVSHYAELGPDEAGVLPGSLGTLELSLAGASLAASWGVARGARVTVRLSPEPRPID